jgi:hypothetical protein
MLSQVDVKFYHQLSDSDQDEWLFERSACDQSAYYFTVQMGSQFPEDGGDLSVKLHKRICGIWQDPSVLDFFYYMPRDWRKSSMSRWLALWSYLQNNEIRILLASQKLDLPKKFLGSIQKNALQNERLRWLYPVLLQVDKSYTRSCGAWASEYCVLPRRGIYPDHTFQCIGITGAAQGGHFDLIIPDDMIGEKGMESTVVMEDALRWWDNVDELKVQPIKTLPNASRIRGLGTHWCQGDVGCYIQENYPSLQWMIVPALKDTSLKDTHNVTWVQDPDVDQGESNWGEWFPTKHYTDMLGTEKETVFYCQHQNNPSQAGGGLNKFDKAWLKYFRFDKRDDGEWIVCKDDGEEFKLSTIPLYGMIDPGGFSEIKLIKAGSRNASLIGGQPYGSVKKFIVHAHAARFKDPETFAKPILEANDKFRPKVWRIDTAAQQRYIYTDVISAAKKHGTALRITPLPPDTRKDSKDLDIQSLLDPFFRGEYYILDTMTEFIGEYVSYPTGFTKDLIDCAGKLNVHYWTRKEKKRPAGKRVETLSESEGRSETTGY